MGRVLICQRDQTYFFLDPKQRLSKPPLGAAKIFSHIMKGGETMDSRSTITEFGIDDLNKILGVKPIPEESSKPAYLLATREDIKEQIRNNLKRIFNK